MKTRDTKGPLSEINVIPLVDVMLVLRIVFMIAAPMMQHGLGIDIPNVTARALPAKDEPQILNVTKDQRLILNEKKIEFRDLKQAVQFLFANREKKEIYLRADKDVPYGFVVRCMGTIREAGVDKVNIVTKPLDRNE